MRDDHEEVADAVPDAVPDDVPDDGSTDGDATSTDSEAEPTGSMGASPRPRKNAAMVAVLVLIGFWATIEVSSPLLSTSSLSRMEQAFSQRPKSGLTLEAAQDSVLGWTSVSLRDEPKGKNQRVPVRFAVFRWPSLLKDHSFEVEVEEVAKGKFMVRSQPYIKVVAQYDRATPEAKEFSPALQLMALDHEPDSKASHRVERWQVERAIKEKRAKPSLLEFFDKTDEDADGAVTPSELGMGPSIEPGGNRTKKRTKKRGKKRGKKRTSGASRSVPAKNSKGR